MLLCLLSMNMQAMQSQNDQTRSMGCSAITPRLMTKNEVCACRVASGGCGGFHVAFCFLGIPLFATNTLPAGITFCAMPFTAAVFGSTSGYWAHRHFQPSDDVVTIEHESGLPSAIQSSVQKPPVQKMYID
jgi:hypothetical protein